MEKVAVNEFVRRQVKGSGKTYSDSLSFEEITEDAERQMDGGNFIEGYRNGVRIVKGSAKSKDMIFSGLFSKMCDFKLSIGSFVESYIK